MTPDYANNILEAIELLAEKKVNEAGYDKTIKAIITSTDKSESGLYTCKYESTLFTAVGDKNRFSVDDVVMVNIPGNDWSNTKTILNKVYYERVNTKSLNPFENFININEFPFLASTGEVGVLANSEVYDTSVLARGDNSAYDEPYTHLGIEVSFKTVIGTQFKVKKGVYGLKIKFLEDNNLLAIYDFSSLDMFGNIYNFSDYLSQRFVIKIEPDIIKKTNNIIAELYQNNNFYTIQDDGTESYLTYGDIFPDVEDASKNLVSEDSQFFIMTEDNNEIITTEGNEPLEYFNIFARDLKLYYGQQTGEKEDGDFVLTSSSSPQYYKSWEIEKNTKIFDVVYYYTNSLNKLTRIKLSNLQTNSYTYNDNQGFVEELLFILQKKVSGEWIDVSTTDFGFFTDCIQDIEELESETIEYRVRCEHLQYNPNKNLSSIYQYSNSIIFYRFQPTITSKEQDYLTALKYEQIYYDGLNYLNELRYNNKENQLYSQEESLCPHYIFMKWEPLTDSFRTDTFLSNATVTFRIPATYMVNNYNENDKASYRLNEEVKTLFIQPQKGIEYEDNNDTVRFENYDGVNYLCYDVTLPPDFSYSSYLDVINAYKAGDKEAIKTFDFDTKKLQGLICKFRPKEYYLPTMVNNAILCTIKTEDNLEFNCNIEIPIENVDFSKTKYRTLILTEDMEKPFIRSYLENNTIDRKRQIFHFATYRKNYNSSISFGGAINLLRSKRTIIVEEEVEGETIETTEVIDFPGIFQQGYWYYNDDDELTESTSQVTDQDFSKIRWYTLVLPENMDNTWYDYLELQNETQGMTSIINIPQINIDAEKDYIYILSGMDRIYYGTSGVLDEDAFGPIETPYFLKRVNGNKSIDGYSGIAEVKDDFNNTISEFSGLDRIGLDTETFYPVIEEKTVTYSDETEAVLEKTQMYLRYNQVGFTKNYAKVGDGDSYPSTQFRTSYEEEPLVFEYYLNLPIVFQRVMSYRDDFYEWDGDTVTIGDDAVYSPVIGAGTKIADKFTGLLMGDISRVDQGVSRRSYGLYGYKEDEQVFGLRSDGTMFLGKDGNGQLLLNGNKATIQSSLYDSTTGSKGMLIDFDDGIIDMKNNISDTNYQLLLNVKSNNLGLTDKPLKIGVNGSPKFSVDWSGNLTSTGGTIGGWTIGADSLSGSGSGGTLTLSSSSESTYPLQIGSKFKVDWVGNVTANQIDLRNGTLTGNNQTIIQNVKVVNNTGHGLNFDGDGNLILDAGIKMGAGSFITADDNLNSYIGLNNGRIGLKNIYVADSLTMYGQNGGIISLLGGQGATGGGSLSATGLNFTGASGISLESGNISLSSGNITLTSGTINFTNGSLTLPNGKFNVGSTNFNCGSSSHTASWQSKAIYTDFKISTYGTDHSNKRTVYDNNGNSIGYMQIGTMYISGNGSTYTFNYLGY